MNDDSFTRINADNFEVAFRSFKKNELEVCLIGMAHFAQETFYRHVEEKTRAQIVIYEMAGCDYAQKVKQTNAILQLSLQYQRHYANIRRLQCPYELVASAYKLTSQNDADFLSAASELIHADIIAPPKYARAYENNESIIKLIDDVTSDILKQVEPNSTNAPPIIDDIVSGKLSKLPRLKIIIEEDLKSSHKGPHEEQRINLIKKRLREVFERKPVVEKIVVVYGAAHQAAIAQFLRDLGFELVNTEWSPVTALSYKFP